MRRKKKGQRLLGYHIYFNTIKDSNGQTIAKINGHQIVSDDELFFKSVLSSNTIVDVEPNDLNGRKIKYTLYNQTTKQIVAKLDSYFNIYTLDDIYLGTLFNSTKSIIFILICTFFSLLTLLISFVILQVSTNPAKPKELIISEKDGAILYDKWNIFGDKVEEKILYPGKVGEYYFNVTNTNDFAVTLNMEFYEDNLSNLPMQYRLVLSGQYALGDEYYWVNLDNLDLENVTIAANQTLQFRLDWIWIDWDNDEFDTEIGIDATAHYTIYIKITSTIMYVN